jgi:UDP-N-acetyl-2-amino-2-deoxyglucuronate dehydrogenase
MGGEEIEFSDGFTDLHTFSYASILKGEGFGLSETRPAIELAYQIRNAFKK